MDVLGSIPLLIELNKEGAVSELGALRLTPELIIRLGISKQLINDLVDSGVIVKKDVRVTGERRKTDIGFISPIIEEYTELYLSERGLRVVSEIKRNVGLLLN